MLQAAIRQKLKYKNYLNNFREHREHLEAKKDLSL
jgi:hypothetical protein